MSLLIWYPLTKDFKNYGILYDKEFDKFDSDWSTYRSTNGKVGTYSLDCSRRYSIGKTPLLKWRKVNELSITFWVYRNEDSNGNTVDIGDNSGLRVRFSNNRIMVHYYDTISKSIKSTVLTNTSDPFSLNRWYHIGVTYKDGIFKAYIDGSLHKTTDTTDQEFMITNDVFMIGGAGFENGEILKGCLSDIRIYDECISPLQIKEISKGLIAHYNFNSETNQNLLSRSDLTKQLPSEFTSEETANNVTSKGLTSDGYRIVTPSSGNPNNGVCFGISDFTTLGIKWGDTVTFSVDMKVISSDSNLPFIDIRWNRHGTGWYQDLTSERSYAKSHNEWQRLSITTTLSPEASDYTSKKLWLHIASNYQAELYLKNIKLEAGSQTEYSEKGEKFKVIDSSGYLNNLTTTDTNKIPHYSNGSSEGKNSLSFDGTNYISDTTNPIKFPTKMEQFSFSIWCKNDLVDTWSSYIFFKNAMLLWELKSNNNSRIRFWSNGNYYKTDDEQQIEEIDNTNDYKWHHHVFTYNKGTYKKYLDGRLTASVSGTTEYMDGGGTNIVQIGTREKSATYGFFKGNLDDVRIYATALSGEDVQKLYEVKARMDDNSNVLANNFIENDNVLLAPTIKTLDGNFRGGATQEIIKENGIDVLKVTVTAIDETQTTTYNWGKYWTNGSAIWGDTQKKFVEGGKYVWSMYIRSDSVTKIRMWAERDTTPTRTDYFKVTPEWTKISGVINYSTAYQYSAFVFYNNKTVDDQNLKVGDSFYIHSFEIREYKENNIKVDNKYDFISNSFNETTERYYTMRSKELDDGSKWIRIFYHNCKDGTNLFTTLAEVRNTTSDGKYSRLYLLDDNTFKGSDNKFEFMLTYPTDTDKYNRWKQTNNPCDEFVTNGDGSAFAEGYEAVHIDWTASYWGGLTREVSDPNTLSSCYLSGSVGHSNWFYAIGAKSKHQTGIPSYGTSTANDVELWVRVDNSTSGKDLLDRVIMTQYNTIKSNGIIEV